VRSVQYRQKYATKMEDAIAAKRLSLVALAMSRSVLNEARQRLRVCMLRDLSFAIH
jgi:hypothetical protein